MKIFQTAAAIAFALTTFSAAATDYPAPKEGDWVARDFKFHTGEVMPELRLHYTTIGSDNRMRRGQRHGRPWFRGSCAVKHHLRPVQYFLSLASWSAWKFASPKSSCP